MSIINFAIIIAVMAMLLNFALQAKLTYDQMLRITVYAIVPPTIITVTMIFLSDIKDETWINVIFFTTLALYELYAIIGAKRYLM